MASEMDYIESLQDAIRKHYGCMSKHVERVPVEEVVDGKTVWKGTVEVFDLIGYEKTKRAYAWGHALRETGKDARTLIVLGIPPVDSARQAVQASLAADAKATNT